MGPSMLPNMTPHLNLNMGLSTTYVINREPIMWLGVGPHIDPNMDATIISNIDALGALPQSQKQITSIPGDQFKALFCKA